MYKALLLIFFIIPYPFFSQELSNYTGHKIFQAYSDDFSNKDEAESNCWSKIYTEQKKWSVDYLKDGNIVITNSIKPIFIIKDNLVNCNCRKEVYYLKNQNDKNKSDVSDDITLLVYDRIKKTKWYKNFNHFFDSTFNLVDVKMAESVIELSPQKLNSLPIIIDSESKTYVNCTDEVKSQEYKKEYTKTNNSELKFSKSISSLETIDGSISIGGSLFKIKTKGSYAKNTLKYALEEFNKTQKEKEEIKVKESRNIDVTPQTIMEFNSIIQDETKSQFFDGTALIDGYIVLVPKLDLVSYNMNQPYSAINLKKDIFNGKNPVPLNVDDDLVKKYWKQLNTYLYYNTNLRGINTLNKAFPTNSSDMMDYVRKLRSHPQLTVLNHPGFVNEYSVYLIIIPLRDILSTEQRKMPINGIFSHTIRKEKITIDTVKCNRN